MQTLGFKEEAASQDNTELDVEITAEKEVAFNVKLISL